MRATDGLQTTINLGPVHRDDQAFSLQLSLRMSLPVPSQDEHLPDQIEAFVHQAGLQIQCGSSEPSSRRPTRRSCRTAAAKPAPVSSAGGRGRFTSQYDLRRGHRPAVADQPQARRHHRGPLGQGLGHPTNCTSPGTSGMRSVISSAIHPRARAVPRSPSNAWDEGPAGSARSSTSCIRRASNWSAT